MLTWRYHLMTLVAIFLALGLGMLVGISLSDSGVVKMYVPPGAGQYRLHIPQSNKPGKSKEDESGDSSNPFVSDEPAEIVKPF